MKEITNIKNLDFKSWNNIKQNQTRISVCWGKTFFYYDSNKGKLYYENFSIFGRILRKIFGYKKKYNQENLWRYLTSKKIVVGESPSKGFRKVVAEKLLKLSSLRTEFFQKIRSRGSSEDEIIELFEQGLDINVYDRNPSNTALLNAASEGRLKVVEYLIEKGADVNTRYEESESVSKTPLQRAIFLQHEELIHALLNADADVNEKDFYDNTALHKALKNLIKNQQQPSDEKFKMYYYPGEELEGPKNPKKIIEAIFEKKPDLNVPNKAGETPLYLACKAGVLEVVKKLVDNGADINGVKPPIFAAIEKGNHELVSYLIEKGAKLNFGEERKDWGDTPLTIAAKNGGKKLVQLLVDNGADVNKGPGTMEITPLHIVAERGNLKLVTLFLNNGADIDKEDGLSRTALYYALNGYALNGEKFDIAKFLINKGAQVNSTDGFGDNRTLLHIAVESGNLELVKLFLDKGAKINSQTRFVWLTPLHIAVEKGYKEIEQVLLERGAYPKIKNRLGNTPQKL